MLVFTALFFIYYSSHDGLFDFIGLICLKTKQRQKWLLAALKLKSTRIGALYIIINWLFEDFKWSVWFLLTFQNSSLKMFTSLLIISEFLRRNFEPLLLAALGHYEMRLWWCQAIWSLKKFNFDGPWGSTKIQKVPISNPFLNGFEGGTLGIIDWDG